MVNSPTSGINGRKGTLAAFIAAGPSEDGLGALLSTLVRTCCVCLSRVTAVCPTTRREACRKELLGPLLKLLSSSPPAAQLADADKYASHLTFTATAGAQVQLGPTLFRAGAAAGAGDRPGSRGSTEKDTKKDTKKGTDPLSSARTQDTAILVRRMFEVCSGVPCIAGGGLRNLDASQDAGLEAETAMAHILLLQVSHAVECGVTHTVFAVYTVFPFLVFFQLILGKLCRLILVPLSPFPTPH